MGPDSKINYNYIHDITRSIWATTQYTPTYPIAAVYLDEGSTGITIDRNCINNVEEKWRINYNKSKERNNEGENPYNDPEIISNAGLEAAYADIKTNEIPGVASPVWPQGSALTASNVGESSVTLTWASAQDESGVTGYRIYKDSELIETVSGNVNSYIVTGLTAGTDFRFSVQAGNAKDCWSVDGPVTYVTTQGIDTQTLSQKIAEAQTLLENAPIGNEEGQYAQWAKEYLEAIIFKAQSYLNSGGLTREGLDFHLDKLLEAKEAFNKSKVTLNNVAQGMPVTSSDGDNISSGHPPANVVDGSSSHMGGWDSTSSQSVKAWVQIDLKDKYIIKRVEYVDRTEFDWIGYRSNFEIQVSNDPTFATYEVLGGVGPEGFEDDTTWWVDVTDQTPYQYVRFQKTKVEYAYVVEIRVFAVPEPENYTVGGTVFDGAQNPIAGATVSLYSYDDQTTPIGTAVTAADGSYTIDTEHLPGKYIVKAEKEGYYRGESTVYIPYADVNDAQIILTPLKNIALGKPVTSSDGDNTSKDHPPSNVVDGSASHMKGWDCQSSGSTRPWVQIDLENEYIITRIEYVDRTEFDWIGYRNNFEFQVSNDPDFATYKVLGGVGPEGFEDDTTWGLDVSDETPYRYVRFQRTSTEYIYVVEIRVFGIPAAPVWPEGSELKATNISSTGVTLTWTAANDGAPVTEYRIYKDSQLLTTVAGNILSYNVTGLNPETEYTFKVEAGDAAGNWTENGPSVTVTTSSEGPDFVIEAPVFKDALGNTMTQLKPNTDLRTNVEITNSTSDPGNACIIVALYGPDNTFKTYSAVEGIIKGNSTVTFSAGFKLPDDVSGHYVKVFVWNSMEEIVPISEAYIFQ